MFVDLNDPNREVETITINSTEYEFNVLFEEEAKQIQLRIDHFEGSGKKLEAFWTAVAKEVLSLWNDVEDDFRFASEKEIVEFINILHRKINNAPYTHLEDLQ